MGNTKISVVIPIWNGAKTIEATVRSCLDQSLPPIEILVCDDGSTDNSKEVVQGIGDSKVVWLSGNHSGSPAGPRNHGLSISKGDWVAFCDSDDEWLPTKLEKQIKLAKKLNYRAVCTNALIKINGVITSKKVSNWKNETISFKNLLKTNNVVCSSAMIHISIFREISGFSEIVKYGAFADYIYWLRVATKTNFAYFAEPLVIYDDHPETSMRSNKISDSVLKTLSFNDFKNWAKKQGVFFSYFFILQINTYLTTEWVKKLLLGKIQLR